MVKAVIFDLDGTLLPMNEDEFAKGYLGLLYKNLAPYGHEKESFINAILKGTFFMKNNNGEMTNQQAFWNCYAQIFGVERLEDIKYFDYFYQNDFAKTKAFCGFNEKVKEVIDYCKEKGYKIILASNPLFPRDAMEWRLKFAGLNTCDFDYISDYSNSSYAKPNPKFLKEILDKNNLQVEEVVYFGNSEIEDGKPAKELGIKVYMVGDDIVEDKDNPKQFKQIRFEEIKNLIME